MGVVVGPEAAEAEAAAGAVEVVEVAAGAEAGAAKEEVAAGRAKRLSPQPRR